MLKCITHSLLGHCLIYIRYKRDVVTNMVRIPTQATPLSYVYTLDKLYVHHSNNIISNSTMMSMARYKRMNKVVENKITKNQKMNCLSICL